MGNIIWLITVAGLLCVLQAWYYSKVAFKNLSYQRTVSKTAVFEGERVDIIEVLANRKLTPLPWLRVESLIPRWLKFESAENREIKNEQFHKSVFYVKGYSRTTRRFEVRCIRRGYYDLTRTSVSVGDIFGLNVVRRDYDGDARLFVYPRVLDRSELGPDALKFQGDVTVRRWILPDPLLVNGVREYRPGDSRRDIHWRASARTGTLHVKTRDYTISPRILIVLNVEPEDRASDYITPRQADSLEGSLRTAASLADWAVRNGIEAGLYSNGENRLEPGSGLAAVRPGCSDRHLETILQVLAALMIKRREPIYRTLERIADDLISETDIVVLSTFWNEGLERRAGRLRGMNNTVTHIPVRREAVKFEDIGTETPA